MKSLTDSGHLSQDLIFRLLDDELTTASRLECEAHIARCEVCRRELASLHEFSMRVESAVQSMKIPAMDATRLDLQKRIDLQTQESPMLQHPSKVMRRFGWGMCIAATLAFGVLVGLNHDFAPQPDSGNLSQASTFAQTTTIEVDGETFLPVPYSNADLSTTAPHIVQMQVPVSSLADIGIVFEPVTSRADAGSEPETDRSVLADVLVGADGQPRGVHVVGLE